MYTIDLHNDWSDNALFVSHKNFFKRNSINEGWNSLDWPVINQVDLPRLKEGKINAVFTAACLLPEQMTMKNNIRKYCLEEHLNFYEYIIKHSNNQIYKIQKVSDFKKNGIGIILHIEGYYFHDIEDTNFSYIDELYAKGVRSIGLTWNIDNAIGGGANSNTGLTNIGKKFVQKLNNMGIIIDLAHTNETTFNDVLSVTKKPVIVSHTQLKSMYASPRNISDKQAINVAKLGGIIGLMPYGKFLGEASLERYITSLKYLKDLIGINHIAIGTDFDGMTKKEGLIEEIKETSDFKKLPEILGSAGFSQEEIEKILGKNVKNFIKKVLT